MMLLSLIWKSNKPIYLLLAKHFYHNSMTKNSVYFAEKHNLAHNLTNIFLKFLLTVNGVKVS